MKGWLVDGFAGDDGHLTVESNTARSWSHLLRIGEDRA
jgi:hypothetical protein